MSGLLALLDDVAGIAKVAAASVDDVVAGAAKAGAKAAGAVIDDAAVTPKYVDGFSASRELPIVWKIARGSIINKLVYLLPAALALNAFAPWLIAPLLMLGGAYLCFEGAEKIAHALFHHETPEEISAPVEDNPQHLEAERVSGAIKTDFILSAEIMTIALAAIPAGGFWMTAATLFAVAVMITVAVYGAVALIVKADDVGLYMAKNSGVGLLRAFGRGLVRAMPYVMKTLTIVGTAAMLWVGGSIIIHGLGEMGWHAPEEWIHHIAQAVGHLVPADFVGIVEWTVTAAIDGVFGLAIGLALIPIGEHIITPIWRGITRLNPLG